MTTPIPFDDFGGTGPVLHFAHPNAYPPACFAPMLEQLTADYRVIAAHHRPLWPGHAPEEFKNWQLIADDLNQFLSQQGYEGIIGVGHSLGAVATMKVAYQHPDQFSKIVLIEPVFFPPDVLQMLAANPAVLENSPLAQQARKRRETWPSRRAAFDHYRNKSVFKRWSEEALWAYVNEGLVQNARGQLTLAFPREWEARIYASIPLHIWEEIPQIPQRTLAIRGADSDTLTQEAWRNWQRLQPGAAFVEIPDAGHMLPMEQTAAVVKIVKDFLAQN